MDRDPRPHRVLDYQLECLRAELDFLTRPNAPRAGFAGFVRKHGLQLYWTLTRLAGFSHLHDGSRRAASRRPIRVDVAADMPEDAVCSLDPARPRLLIDISTTVFIAQSTGIQVVVREFASACYRSGVGLPVFISKGQVYSALEPPGAPPVPLRRGDCLFLLDASWATIGEIVPVADRIEAMGGSIVACIYDLVPFLHPQMCPPGVVSTYARWFEVIRPRCAALFCISRTVAAELEAYLRRSEVPGASRLRIEWFDLGVRGDLSARDQPASSRISRLCKRDVTYLSVGTLEPRKGYPVALAAFDRLWAQGSDVEYLILGRRGWNMRFFERQIRAHPRYGTRLHWIADASDGDLAYAYAHTRALVVPSIAEGFGLPLVEAAHFGLPRILSDLPIFREVAGDAARYFETCDARDLARVIAEDRAAPRIDRTTPAPAFSWNRSALRVRDLIWSQTEASRAAPR